MNSTMIILEVTPGHKPERKEIPHTLEAMQSIVGGSIQAVYPYGDPVAIVCNEEGKLLGMEPNRAIRNPDSREIVDIICGPFFVCGLGEDDFCSLTEELVARYESLFRYPELFLWNGTNIVVLPMEE